MKASSIHLTPPAAFRWAQPRRDLIIALPRGHSHACASAPCGIGCNAVLGGELRRPSQSASTHCWLRPFLVLTMNSPPFSDAVPTESIVVTTSRSPLWQ
jgi:hypothetical protein